MESQNQYVFNIVTVLVIHFQPTYCLLLCGGTYRFGLSLELDFSPVQEIKNSDSDHTCKSDTDIRGGPTQKSRSRTDLFGQVQEVKGFVKSTEEIDYKYSEAMTHKAASNLDPPCIVAPKTCPSNPVTVAEKESVQFEKKVMGVKNANILDVSKFGADFEHLESSVSHNFVPWRIAHSKFRFVWNLIYLFGIVCQTILTSLAFAFTPAEWRSNAMFWIPFTFDIFFVVDVLLQMFFFYFDDAGIEVIAPLEVFRQVRHHFLHCILGFCAMLHGVICLRSGSRTGYWL
jgi:hypothetical protein